MHRSTFVRLLLAGLCLAGLVFGLVRYSRTSNRLNLLIITLDTTRADHLGCYGRSQAKTPVLDSLAKSGVLFERAYASVAMTLPSHATMFTGLQPPEHGLHINGEGRLAVTSPTLAEVLEKRGYVTGAFVASFVLHSKFGLNRGFQTYDDEMAGGERHGSETHLMRNGKQVVDAALSWLSNRSQSPFLCWVHLYDPHIPYDAHEELFGDRFKASPYDGDIAYVDEQVGRLVHFLKERKLDDRTVVVIVGDHGEGLGDHDEAEHGMLVYNSTIQVPLIVAGPSLCKAGHRVSSPVSLVDLFPTIMDCLRVKSPQAASGRSVLAALGGATIEPHLCYSEAHTPFLAYGWSPLQSLINDEWKYIKTTREELYDLRSDPSESKNLAESQPDQLAEMRVLLESVTEQMVEYTGINAQLSESDRMKLESLGYVAGRKGDQQQTSETLPDVKDMLRHYNSEIAARELLEAGKLDEAEARLREVIHAAPSFVTARTTLGRVLQRQKRVEEAVDVYEDALKQQPDSAEAHFDLAVVLAGRGELDAAIEHYSKALETGRLRSITHINLAGVYAFKGEANLAREHFELGLKEFPDSASGHFGYGMFLAKQGAINDALSHIQRAVKLDPGSALMRYHLGFILLSLGKFSEAESQFEESLRLDPQNARTRVQLERAKAHQPPSR